MEKPSPLMAFDLFLKKYIQKTSSEAEKHPTQLSKGNILSDDFPMTSKRKSAWDTGMV